MGSQGAYLPASHLRIDWFSAPQEPLRSVIGPPGNSTQQALGVAGRVPCPGFWQLTASPCQELLGPHKGAVQGLSDDKTHIATHDMHISYQSGGG